MIIATLADLHLNKGVYKKVMDRKEYPTLPFRSADFMRAFKWSIKECIELNPDLVVIAGDIYDHPEPSNEIRGFFSEQLSELILNGIAVRILIGNHDVCKKNHALNDIEGLCLPNIKVIASPELEFFRNKKGEEIRLLLFPYSLDIERGAATIKAEFHNFIDKVAKSASVDCPSLFFGHFPVYGGIMNRYNVGEDENLLNPTITDTTSTLAEDINQKEYKNINKEDVGIDDLNRLSSVGVTHVFLGDFHEFQFVGTSTCKAWYCGSLEKNSFNEKKHLKGFLVYDDSISDVKMGKCKQVYYPNCRPMIDLFGTLSEMREAFNKVEFSKHQEAIVRLNFKGSDEEIAEFKTNLEEFKSEIISKTNAIHIYDTITLTGVVGTDISKTLAVLEQSLQEKGHMEAADVIEVVNEMIIERIKEEDEAKATYELAKEIYKKTVSKDK